MTVRLAGIQPGYLPWLGYFDQMRRVDVFVLADEMQFSSTGWAHRNRVRGPRGPHWLTLPVRAAGEQRIGDVVLDPRVPWAKKHLRTLRHFYRRSPWARDLLHAIERVITPAAERLVDASLPLLRWLAAELGITTPLVLSSEHALERRYLDEFPDAPGPTQRIIAFMKALGADELLEGAAGRAYLDVALCEAHGIRVAFHDYVHPVYRQLHEPFISHLSAIDLLLCAGAADARQVLRSVP